MNFTCYRTVSGMVTRDGVCQNAMFNSIAHSDETILEGTYPGHIYWFDGGIPTLRPQIGLPETHSIATETDWTITGVPDGTEVLTDGESLGAVTGGEVALTFPQAGLWRVVLRPPFPWRDATCEVTVT